MNDTGIMSAQENQLDSYMENKEWGPVFWSFIDMLIITYDESFPDAYINFLYAMHDLLPCWECQEHYYEYITDYTPEDVNTKEELKEWILKLHNTINERCGKKKYTMEDREKSSLL